MVSKLAARFSSLWDRCAGEHSDAVSVWAVLEQRYTEQHRFYHNLDHIDHCLSELDQAGSRVQDRDAVELAIWFHDVVFDIGASDNEEKSAALFQRMAQPGIPPQLVDEVCRLISATVHAEPAQDSAAAYMVDIDLSSFGLPWEEYQRDSDNLRREEAATPDQDFYRAKLQFLDSLLDRPSIFQTAFYRERYEKIARKNINAYTGLIGEWGSRSGTND